MSGWRGSAVFAAVLPPLSISFSARWLHRLLLSLLWESRLIGWASLIRSGLILGFPSGLLGRGLNAYRLP